MFTGLVEGLGRVVRADRSGRGVRLALDTPLAGELQEGASIAVNGVCLTAVDVQGGSFTVEVMNETLAHTSLKDADVGTEVNLELPLRASDRLGGHVVQGHVDGVGTVLSRSDDGFARRVDIAAGPEVLRYLVRKGSVAVDGVSLTVAELENGSFSVSLIPETLQRTTLAKAGPGARVNLEVDVLAKYVENALQSHTVAGVAPDGEQLRR